jgi:spore coat protein A
VTVSRRRFLGLLGAGGAAAALTGCAGPAGLGSGDRPQTAELMRSRLPLPRAYRQPLPVPLVARPVRVDAAGEHYEIVQREADLEIVPGVRTRAWTYGGTFPGPTVVTRRGRPAVVRHTNQLPVPTAVHLHGGHTPPDSDGFPTDLVDPAAAFAYTYPMDQRAATLWYHDHRMDFTGPQVYRGLAGFHLVRDDEEDALPLPRGEREIPLMITDRAFDDDGAFRYPSADAGTHHHGVQEDFVEGVLGDVVLVNGAPWPVLEVAAVRYRFRLLNASNARRYTLALDGWRGDGEPFVQIGSDGGLLSRPVSHRELAIAAAERFDVVVDFSGLSPGDEVTMVNRAGTGSTARVMRFRVTGRAADDSRVPRRLSTIERLDAGTAVAHRDWRFSRGRVGSRRGWLINGRSFDPDRSDASPRLGDVEVWRFATDLHHPVHVHLAPFQVLRRSGGKPRPYDAGWKDTVDVRPSEDVEVLVRFTGYRGRYLLHCHNLEHEDMAMMSAFSVT